MVANRTAILNLGRITHEGSPDSVITSANRKETYGVDARVFHLGDGREHKVRFPVLS
jgi:ABC-type cobalamin/Fe3+-siderophores transport system ATPase subunit